MEKKKEKCYVPNFYVADSLPFTAIYQMVSPWLGEIKKNTPGEMYSKSFLNEKLDFKMQCFWLLQFFIDINAIEFLHGLGRSLITTSV